MSVISLKTHFLKSLDGNLCRILCGIASRLPKRSDRATGEVLIIRPGGMGDLIAADIALRDLGLDQNRFTWLIEKRSQPWADYRHLKYHCYDINPLQTLSRVWNRYDLIINTEQLFGLTQAYALLALAKEGSLVSFQTNRASQWSKVVVPYDWRDEHETVAFARLFARALEIPYAPKESLLRPRLHPASSGPLVLIAGRQSPSRNLNLEQWVTLIAQSYSQRPFLIAAAPEDADFANRVARRFPALARVFTGSFADLCGQIAGCEEIFTMDGGGVHIASFFGVPTLALFTSGRDRKWHPLGEGSRLIRRNDLACQPCTKFGQVPPCPHQLACLQLEKLSPAVVAPFTDYSKIT